MAQRSGRIVAGVNRGAFGIFAAKVAAQALSRIGFDIDFEGHFFFDRVQAIAQLIKV